MKSKSSLKTICPVKAENEFWDDQDIREIGLATVEKNGYLYFAVAAHWPEGKSKELYAHQMAFLIGLWEGANN